MNKLLKRIVVWYDQLDDVPQYLVSLPIIISLFFGTIILLTRGCAYITGVPQKFAAQEAYIATLGAPAGSREIWRHPDKPRTDRAHLYVSYKVADTPENIFAFYDHALPPQGWKKLSHGKSDEKRWCKKNDLLIVKLQKQDAAEQDFSVSLQWSFLQKKPLECYPDIYGVGESYE